MLSGNTGEFIYSLPVVLACSLVASRITSMTFVPLLGYYLLRPTPAGRAKADPRGGLYYRVAHVLLDHRWITLAAAILLLALGGYTVRGLNVQFFPKDLSYLSYVDIWMPEDATVPATDAVARRVEQIVRDVAVDYGRSHKPAAEAEGVLRSVTTFVGGGAPRFWFSLAPVLAQPNYAQLVVNVADKHDTEHLVPLLQQALSAQIAGAQVDVRQLETGKPVGIPYMVVSGTQRAVPIDIGVYAHESDAGPYPVPPDAPIEGGPGGTNDRHVIVVDRDNNRLYEMYRAFPVGDGSWKADGGAVFHLDSNRVRPMAGEGWSSADAAGLPIFPGLVRYDEASRGLIAHALRFTVERSRKAYVPPATHWASPNPSPNLPPMGMRVRLKASFAIPDDFSTEGKAILQALKTYGMFMADNRANWFLSGAPDPRWNNDRLRKELGSVKGSDFEVLRMDGLVTP